MPFTQLLSTSLSAELFQSFLPIVKCLFLTPSIISPRTASETLWGRSGLAELVHGKVTRLSPSEALEKARES